jgi:hypothetical protein
VPLSLPSHLLHTKTVHLLLLLLLLLLLSLP